MKKRKPITCGECRSQRIELVSASAIYPHREDLWEGKHGPRMFWRCRCGAYVGTHPGTTEPLGSPAGPATRAARAAAHEAFDPLWRKRMRISNLPANKARGRGYRWLADQLGITTKECHIGMMSEAMARRVVDLCKKP